MAYELKQQLSLCDPDRSLLLLSVRYFFTAILISIHTALFGAFVCTFVQCVFQWHAHRVGWGASHQKISGTADNIYFTFVHLRSVAAPLQFVVVRCGN